MRKKVKSIPDGAINNNDTKKNFTAMMPKFEKI